MIEPLWLTLTVWLVAASAADGGDGRKAARLLGATDEARRRMELERDDDEAFVRTWIEMRLTGTLEPEDLATAARAIGR